MCFPSNLLSSFFESDLEQSFFGEVGELAEVAPYDDSLEPLATEEEAVSQCKNGSRSRTNIQLSQITNTEILPMIQQILLFHVSVALWSVCCFLLLLFCLSRYGPDLLRYPEL